MFWVDRFKTVGFAIRHPDNLPLDFESLNSEQQCCDFKWIFLNVLLIASCLY